LSVTSSSDILIVRAQDTFPDNIFASTSQAQLHELVLKATQENGQTNTISGFKIDLTNVISAPLGSELAVFTTDGTLSVSEAKLKTTADAFVDLKRKSQSSFSLAGLPSGVYTIDIITQKGTASGAYEGILVLGQEPTDQQTRTIIEQQIIKEDEDDDDDNMGDCDPSYPDVCIPPYPPDLNCDDITYKNFKVTGSDPHRFDGDKDGFGCDSEDGGGARPPGNGNGKCDPSYPTVCIKSPPPDLNCGDISHKNFKVTGSDPHGLDRDGDGIGCESNEPKSLIDPCEENPDLPECIDPCEENPNLPECIDPCEENPDLPECIDPCEENPNLPECIDPCEENPELEECQEPSPPEDPCDENPSSPECEEEEAFIGESDDEDGSDEDSDSENENEGESDEGNEDESDEE
jgi:hypothetical protein